MALLPFWITGNHLPTMWAYIVVYYYCLFWTDVFIFSICSLIYYGQKEKLQIISRKQWSNANKFPYETTDGWICRNRRRVSSQKQSSKFYFGLPSTFIPFGFYFFCMSYLLLIPTSCGLLCQCLWWIFFCHSEVVSSVTRCQYRFYKFFYIALIIGTKETFNWAKYQYLYITFELSKEMLYPEKLICIIDPWKEKRL